jgi:hypothetical protein
MLSMLSMDRLGFGFGPEMWTWDLAFFIGQKVPVTANGRTCLASYLELEGIDPPERRLGRWGAAIAPAAGACTPCVRGVREGRGRRAGS